MATHVPYKQQKQQSSKVTPLRTFEHLNAFGAHLVHIRNRESLSQQEVADALPQYFEEHKVIFPTSNPRDMYRKTEKGIRATQFEELIPLYATLIGCGIRQSAEERHTFVCLARLKLESLQRRRPKPRPDGEWEWLEAQLVKIDQQQPKGSAQSALDVALSENVFDISHVVGRDVWLKTALSYLHTTPPKKLVVIQGMMGVGKTTCLKLLLHTLVSQDGYQPILHLFSDREDMESLDHLDNFLATLLAKREVIIPETKMPNRQEQIKLLLKDLSKTDRRVILLLDDAQVILDERGQLPPAWQDFFTEYLQRPHRAVIYLATREWSMWPGRDPVYIVDGDNAQLPRLSPEAGVQIWRRFGFDDVDEELLRRATERFGGNPRMIELRATAPQRRKLPFSWEWSETSLLTLNSRKDAKSEHQELIEQLLEDPQIFGTADVEVRQLLQHVVSQHVSHDALPLLEALAVSALALPFPLLSGIISQAEYALVELLDASLLDQTAIANKRAGVQPLTREAVLHTFLKEGRREAIEQQISQLYKMWMDQGTFRDEQEQATLIAEAVILYLKHRQLLEAAELLLSYWWLCALFGQTSRIQRVFNEVIGQDRGKVEDVKHEVGRLLLQHRITIMRGQKVERDERDRMYQEIYGKVVAGEIQLEPHSELEVLHNMLLFYNRHKQFVEADELFDQTLERLQRSQQMTTEVYATFLSDKTLLMVYRADAAEEVEASLQLTQASVNYTREAVANWQLCLKNALPLQEKRIQFKLGRALNDLACDLRTLKQYSDSQKAIEKSIQMKKESGTLPHSIGVALSEYSQILAAQGRLQEALSVSEEAKQLLEQSLEQGGDTHQPELGLILKERAHILLLQARLREAKPLLEQAVELIGNKPLRQKDKREAITLMKEIQSFLEFSRPYQLDRRWFSRYFALISYSDLDMLTQSGPLTQEEQAEWEHLCVQEKNEETYRRMLKIMAKARQRESVRSFEEQRAPVLTYPRIDIEDVVGRIDGLAALRQEIETQEANAIVCRLYLDAIDEHMTFLRLCEATALEDPDTVMQCSLKLFGKPSEREFKIALQQLCMLLFSARTHQLAAPIAREVGTQLEAWGLSPREIMAGDVFLPEDALVQQQKNHALLASESRTFLSTTVCRFFQDVLSSYGERDWNISAPPGREYTSVDPNTRELALPQKPLSVKKIRQLLAEEIEVHTCRAIAGRHSPLALLGSGLAHNIVTDEGLAYHYVQSVSTEIYGEREEKKWNGTLALGFASGILTPVLSFQELRTFLEKMFLVSELLTTDATWDDAVTEARRKAWSRCCRTFRGVPRLDQPGHCFFKDRAYLQGHLEVSSYLVHGHEQRLQVGCIGVEHLEYMTELHILAPNFPHQYLARTTDLADRLASYE